MKRNSSKLLGYVLCAIISLLLSSAQVWATSAQSHIVSAGINLGQASARMKLFGDAFGGTPPPDQITDIATNLANAKAHILAAESLLEQPFSTNIQFLDVLKEVVRKIDNYGNATRNASHSHRAKYIESIWGMYRNVLAQTYYSGRQDSFQSNPNCDSTFLDVGYYCGRAAIASAITPPHRRSGARAAYYQSGANSSLRDAIQNGLEIALDGWPPQPNPKKICCAFGSPAEWSVIPDFQSDSATSLYAEACGDKGSKIPKIAERAFVDCGGRPDLPSCSSSPHPDQESCTKNFPGTSPTGKNADGQLVCECPNGIVWDKVSRSCPQQTDQQSCATNFPGTSPTGKNADGQLVCECSAGVIWNQASRCGPADGNHQQCKMKIAEIRNFMIAAGNHPQGGDLLKIGANAAANEARIMGCDQASIDSALGVGGLVDGGTTTEPSGVRFTKPKVSGVALDWCFVEGGSNKCGKSAADNFCRWKGFNAASAFSKDEDVGYTKLLPDGAICDASFCDGFAYIDCVSLGARP